MSLFSAFKEKRKADSDIIASVEEEDISREGEVPVATATPVAVVAPVEPVKEEPVKEEPVEETKPAEEVVNEPVYNDIEDEEYEVFDVEEEKEEPVEEAVEEEPVEEVVEEVVEDEPVEEVVEEVVEEEAVEEIVEESSEKTAEELIEEAFSEEPVESVEEVVEEVVQEEPVEEVVKEPVYQPTFCEKMDIADDNIQRWYDEIKNYALRFKKLTSRISKKYDSINQGRFQFVKISLAGKTLKLNLNMDIEQCDPKYHCVDKKSTKTYEDVPVQMRIKSDRGLKYGKELVDQCAEIHGLIENPKFKPVESLEIIRKHLEIGSSDDIIIEIQDDDE